MLMDNVAHDGDDDGDDVHMVNDHLFLNCHKKSADLILIGNEE